MRKVIKFLIPLIFWGGVQAKADRYAVISEEEFQKIETFDHEICIARGMDLVDNYSRRMYWTCRLRLMERRINDSKAPNAKNKFYIGELKKIRQVIRNILEKIETDLLLENEPEKLKDARPIIRKGSAYYYNLLTLHGYDHIVEQINTRSEIRHVEDLEEKLKIIRRKKSLKNDLENFPECIKYDVNTEDFSYCIELRKRVEECVKIAETKVLERIMSDRFACKKEATEKYPDHMALYNSEYEELKNRKVDEYVINRAEQEKTQRRLEELNRLMTGPRLSETQLLGLRKLEEEKCLKNKEVVSSMLRTAARGECEAAMLKEMGSTAPVPSGENSGKK